VFNPCNILMLLNLIVPFRAPSSKTQAELTVVSFLQFCIVFKILRDRVPSLPRSPRNRIPQSALL